MFSVIWVIFGYSLLLKGLDHISEISAHFS
jgi:hypothetical protein